jgi:integrase
VPPLADDVDALFSAWRASLPQARKYLPAARDYFAASLWRRAGLRISETLMLDIGDWRPDLGEFGKLHIRFGKGSRGRGPKTRLVPPINLVDALVTWWLVDVRHQFGDDWSQPEAPLLPSERRDPHTGYCRRVGDDAMRSGRAAAVGAYLPTWSGKLTPHGLRHFCASSLYAQGMDLKAIQELLGHE